LVDKSGGGSVAAVGAGNTGDVGVSQGFAGRGRNAGLVTTTAGSATASGAIRPSAVRKARPAASDMTSLSRTRGSIWHSRSHSETRPSAGRRPDGFS
jgi:hypothetical protein